MKKVLFFIILILAINSPAQFSIEGHRGARGWLPENTIPSFLKALEMGADTIELDLAVSKDNKLVVSHEPYFSHIISLDPNGKAVPADKEKEYNIYKMDYREVKTFDVGSIGNKDFPLQVKMKAYKPLLSEVFREIAKYAKKHKLKPVRFNIEIKSNPQWDGIYSPTPAVFAKMVNDEIVSAKMEKNVIVQCFDERPLQELIKLGVKYPMALLVSNKDGVEKNLARLGFQPDTYSPHFSLVDSASVESLRKKGIKIVPWTVNEIADLEKMKEFTLDGIITDYPDRAVKVFKN